ncbi:MAG TPA: hypothetical protein VFV05_16915 [Methylomirabilota bacterium]|nr:hypothetical protein [Methylomirabilota bacterium]
MPVSTRGLTLRLLALAVLVIAAGTIVGGAEAARHHHDTPGVYDDRCPLEALATVDRTGGVVAVVTATHVEVAADLVLLPRVVRPALAPAADSRFRAPPSAR